MKRYKVQWAFGDGVGQPNIYTQEDQARDEVAYLLGSWIQRHLANHVQMIEQGVTRPGSAEFEQAAKYMAEELPRLIGEDKVWEAYNLWEDFYGRFEKEFGYPLLVAIGTVIVQGSPETKLSNRFPLLPVTEETPADKARREGHKLVTINPLMMLVDRVVMETAEVAERKAELKDIALTNEQFKRAVQETLDEIGNKYSYMHKGDEVPFAQELREGILKRLFPKSSIGLGAFRSWLVQYRDFGGVWHPGRHTNEARAKHQAQEYLETLLHSLSKHVGMEERARGRTEYIKAAQRLIHQVKRLIENGAIWAAYREFIQFQEDWRQEHMFPLEESIGTMRVLPEPEPEV